MEGILLEFDAKQRKEEDIENIKKEVKLQKRKRQALLEREIKVRNDVNMGNECSSSSYRLPLSVLSREDQTSSNVPNYTEDQVDQLRRLCQLKMRLKATAICHGVTCIRDEASDESKYMFDPYIAGRPYGPYVLRIRYSSGRVILRGHSLPHAVPIQTLFSKHFASGEDTRDQAAKMEAFLENVSKHLRGFLSRQQQFNDLRERFSSDLIKCDAANHCTAISFTLKIDDESSKTSLKMNISMLYDKDAERPQQESLKIDVDPPLDDEANENMKEQLEAFYDMEICDAISEVFNE